MTVLANLGNLPDGSTALIVSDAYDSDPVIVRNFDPDKGTWDHAVQYFDGSLVAFCSYVSEHFKVYNREMAANIVDMFERILDDKGLHIENEERDTQDPTNGANFWGEEYDEVMDGIANILRDYNIRLNDRFGEVAV